MATGNTPMARSLALLLWRSRLASALPIFFSGRLENKKRGFKIGFTGRKGGRGGKRGNWTGLVGGKGGLSRIWLA